MAIGFGSGRITMVLDIPSAWGALGRFGISPVVAGHRFGLSCHSGTNEQLRLVLSVQRVIDAEEETVLRRNATTGWADKDEGLYWQTFPNPHAYDDPGERR